MQFKRSKQILVSNRVVPLLEMGNAIAAISTPLPNAPSVRSSRSAKRQKSSIVSQISSDIADSVALIYRILYEPDKAAEIFFASSSTVGCRFPELASRTVRTDLRMVADLLCFLRQCGVYLDVDEPSPAGLSIEAITDLVLNHAETLYAARERILALIQPIVGLEGLCTICRKCVMQYPSVDRFSLGAVDLEQAIDQRLSINLTVFMVLEVLLLVTDGNFERLSAAASIKRRSALIQNVLLALLDANKPSDKAGSFLLDFFAEKGTSRFFSSGSSDEFEHTIASLFTNLGLYLIEREQPELARKVLQTFVHAYEYSIFTCPATIYYLLGRASARSGDLDKASEYLQFVSSLLLLPEQNSSLGSLIRKFGDYLGILPVHTFCMEIGEFYYHCMNMMYAKTRPDLTSRFARLALAHLTSGSPVQKAGLQTSNLEREQQNSQEGLFTAVATTLFLAQLELSEFQTAYSTLSLIQPDERQKDCLRKFVSILCESGRSSSIEILCQLPLAQNRAEVEKTLLFKARNMDYQSPSIPSTVNYYKILYSFYVYHGDYRAAATAIFKHTDRLKHARECTQEAFEEQEAGLLMTRSALTLVEKSSRWIALPRHIQPENEPRDMKLESNTDLRYNRSQSGESIESESRILDLIEEADVNCELAIVTAKLVLAKIQSTDSSMPTSAEGLLNKLLYFHRFKEAFDFAAALGIKATTIFNAGARMYIAILADPEIACDFSVDLSDTCMDCDAPNRLLAYLRTKLDELGSKPEDVSAMLGAFLSSGSLLDPPAWLIKPKDYIISLYIQYGRTIKAASLALLALKDATRLSVRLRREIRPRSMTLCIPYPLIDNLLATLSDSSSHSEESRTMQLCLEEALKEYFDGLDDINKVFGL